MKGIDLYVSLNDFQNLKTGMFSKFSFELEIIHLKVFKESSHCKCSFIQDILNERTLHGLDSSDEKIKLQKEYEVMEGHISELKILEE